MFRTVRMSLSVIPPLPAGVNRNKSRTALLSCAEAQHQQRSAVNRIIASGESIMKNMQK